MATEIKRRGFCCERADAFSLLTRAHQQTSIANFAHFFCLPLESLSTCWILQAQAARSAERAFLISSRRWNANEPECIFHCIGGFLDSIDATWDCLAPFRISRSSKSAFYNVLLRIRIKVFPKIFGSFSKSFLTGQILFSTNHLV